MLSKYVGWRYENERRILKLHVEEIALAFKPVALSRIYLGCNFDNSNLKVLEDLLKKRQSLGWPSPEIVKTKIHESSYEIVKVQTD
jgi:hypothetical protein